MSSFLTGLAGSLTGFAIVYAVCFAQVLVKRRRVNKRLSKLIGDFFEATKQGPESPTTPSPAPGKPVN